MKKGLFFEEHEQDGDHGAELARPENEHPFDNFGLVFSHLRLQFCSNPVDFGVHLRQPFFEPFFGDFQGDFLVCRGKCQGGNKGTPTVT